jgi:hypothetical protein
MLTNACVKGHSTATHWCAQYGGFATRRGGGGVVMKSVVPCGVCARCVASPRRRVSHGESAPHWKRAIKRLGDVPIVSKVKAVRWPVVHRTPVGVRGRGVETVHAINGRRTVRGPRVAMITTQANVTVLVANARELVQSAQVAIHIASGKHNELDTQAPSGVLAVCSDGGPSPT